MDFKPETVNVSKLYNDFHTHLVYFAVKSIFEYSCTEREFSSLVRRHAISDAGSNPGKRENTFIVNSSCSIYICNYKE